MLGRVARSCRAAVRASDQPQGREARGKLRGKGRGGESDVLTTVRNEGLTSVRAAGANAARATGRRAVRNIFERAVERVQWAREGERSAFGSCRRSRNPRLGAEAVEASPSVISTRHRGFGVHAPPALRHFPLFPRDCLHARLVHAHAALCLAYQRMGLACRSSRCSQRQSTAIPSHLAS